MNEMYIEDLFDEEFFENAINQSDISKILRKKSIENFQTLFNSCVKNSTIGIGYDDIKKELYVGCFINIEEGQANQEIREPLKDVFEHSLFFDGIDSSAEVAKMAGDFFKKISDQCFEIEKTWLED